MYFDQHGEPMELMAWARAFEDAPGRTLARTQVGDSTVITMWIGTADWVEEPPKIFGSVVKTGQTYHGEIRTCTREEAMEAHALLIAGLTAQDGPTSGR